MPVYKHIVLRVDKPNIGKVIGDVIDSLFLETYEGKEVEVLHKHYVRVIADISQELNDDLVEGRKRYVIPPLGNPFYSELLEKGIIAADEQTILNYIENT